MEIKEASDDATLNLVSLAAWLEAENAKLRDIVVKLTLQLQTLREQKERPS